MSFDTSLKERVEHIVKMASSLVAYYNDVNERVMWLNKYNGHEHVMTAEQNQIVTRYRLEAIKTLECHLERLFVDKSDDYNDVKTYEANYGKSTAMETRSIARALFETAWIQYLVYHCGKRKLGWYKILYSLMYPLLDLELIKDFEADNKLSEEDESASDSS